MVNRNCTFFRKTTPKMGECTGTAKEIPEERWRRRGYDEERMVKRLGTVKNGREDAGRIDGGEQIPS